MRWNIQDNGMDLGGKKGHNRHKNCVTDGSVSLSEAQQVAHYTPTSQQSLPSF